MWQIAASRASPTWHGYAVKMNQEPLSSIPTPIHPARDARQNLRWLFVLRNLMIVGEGLIIFISLYGLEIPLREVPLWGILTLLGVFNWWTWLRLGSQEPISENELFIQLSCDVLAITAILYFTGGATNPIAWFFLLPLIIAATVLPQEYTWYMVIFTSGCYTMLMSYYHPLPDIQPIPVQGENAHAMHAMLPKHDLDLHVFGMWFGFVFSAVLVAYFVVEMAKTLRARDRSLAEARELSLRNERVVALGTLAAGAAHEMGTPLGTMAILIREIENDCEAGEDIELGHKMKILREQVARCKQALSVMSVSAGEIRAESGHLMPLTAYLDSVVESWRQQLPGKKLHYRKAGPMPPPGILAELTLTHALINILNNAAEVSLKSIELHARWDQQSVTLRILDSGPDITPSLSEQIGKSPVVSTKDQGLGVGLFLAFATINRLDGSIDMTPRQGGVGTRTQITLPVISHWS
jgi:two-component system sensor histidine kinase RegB